MPTVTMSKHPEIGMTQSTAINQTGMAQAIGDDKAPTADKIWDYACVGEIPGPEHQRCFSPFELR
jgi:hypothetical protein